jgi:hypothetical protein
METMTDCKSEFARRFLRIAIKRPKEEQPPKWDPVWDEPVDTPMTNALKNLTDYMVLTWRPR